MQYRISLLAGIPKRQEMAGQTLVLLDTGAASEIDLKIEISGGYAVEELRGVKRGLKVQAPGFASVMLLAAVDCTVELVASMANISVNYQDGSTVNANILGIPAVTISGQPVNVDTEGRIVQIQEAAPLAVVPNRGGPGAPVYVVGSTIADAPAVTLLDNAAVAVTDAGAALVAADPDRRGLRITNIGVDPVAIGAAGITWAKRCIILESGDGWIEDRAANLAWSAICDAGNTANVTVQEVIS